ncbi:MAG: hypothetical protein ABIA76_00320 [Candidatus Diapherotrites archaeon]
MNWKNNLICVLLIFVLMNSVFALDSNNSANPTNTSLNPTNTSADDPKTNITSTNISTSTTVTTTTTPTEPKPNENKMPDELKEQIKYSLTSLKSETERLEKYYSSAEKITQILNNEMEKTVTSYEEFHKVMKKVNELLYNLVDETSENAEKEAVEKLRKSNMRLSEALELSFNEPDSVLKVLDTVKEITLVLMKFDKPGTPNEPIEVPDQPEPIIEIIPPSTEPISGYDFLLNEGKKIGESINAWNVTFFANGNYIVWTSYGPTSNTTYDIFIHNINSGETRKINVGQAFELFGLEGDTAWWKYYAEGGTAVYSYKFGANNEPQACSKELKTCDNGTTTERDPNDNCNFKPCMTEFGCPRDLKICTDGSTVERDAALKCGFKSCPSTNSKGKLTRYLINDHAFSPAVYGDYMVYAGINNKELVLVDLKEMKEVKRVLTGRENRAYYVSAFNGKYFTANTVNDKEGEDNSVYQEVFDMINGKKIASIYAGKNRYLPRASMNASYIVWLSSSDEEQTGVNLFNFESRENRQIDLGQDIGTVENSLSIDHSRIAWVAGNNNIKIYDLQTGKITSYHYPKDTALNELQFFATNKLVWRTPLPGRGAYDSDPFQEIFIGMLPLKGQSEILQEFKENKTELRQFYDVKIEVAKERHDIKEQEFNELKKEIEELKEEITNSTSTSGPDETSTAIQELKEKIIEANSIVKEATTIIGNTIKENESIKAVEASSTTGAN